MKWKCLRALGLFLAAGMIANALFVVEADTVVEEPVSIEESAESSKAETDGVFSIEDIGVELEKSEADHEESGEESPEAPEESAEPTVNPTEAPEESTEPTVNPTEAPEESTEPTVNPTETPEESAEPTVKPAESSQPSTNPGESPGVSGMGDREDGSIGALKSIVIVASDFEKASSEFLTGWVKKDEQLYWFEDGIQLGLEGEGQEIYDSVSEAWYWLDSSAGGSMAVDKEVFLEEDGGKQVYYGEDGRRVGGEITREGVEYYYEPVTGAMVKGPVVLSDGRKVFYDLETGGMVKGDYEAGELMYHFNENDGQLESEVQSEFWLSIDGYTYRYADWKRQGWKPEDAEYVGEEVYDTASDEWFWLDGTAQGRVASDKLIYLDTQADEEGNIGKWVYYGADGRRIKGWSEDGLYYFDPVYGTRASGILVIDNVEYVFDEETGEKISERIIAGFEAYGLICNAEACVEYEYITAAEMDVSVPIVGKALFDYQVFEADDTHTAREGYEWRQVTVSMTFDGIRAQYFGSRYALLYGLDYYNFQDGEIDEALPEDAPRKIKRNGIAEEEQEIISNYEVLRSEWGEDRVAYVTVRYECQVPVGYDGMVVALYDAANMENSAGILERLDANSLIFRMN